MLDRPDILDWAAAFGPILKEAFPGETAAKRMAVGEALGKVVMDRQSWFSPALTTPPTPDRIGKDAVREALSNLLARDIQNTCQHEDTKRGGSIWEICNDCGAKWADDEGGKPDWQDPPEWTAARRALSATPAQEGPKLCSFCPNPATGWANGESDMMPACDGCQSQHEHHPGFLSFAEKTELEADADANRKLPTRPPAQPVDETERLRSALREIAEDPYKHGQRIQKMKAIARAALQHKGEASRG